MLYNFIWFTKYFTKYFVNDTITVNKGDDFMSDYPTPNKMKYKLDYSEDDYKQKYLNREKFYYFPLTNKDGHKLFVDIDHIIEKLSILNNLDSLFATLDNEGYDTYINAISETRGSLSVEGIHSSKKVVEKIIAKKVFDSEKEQNIFNIVKAYELTRDLDINPDNIKLVYNTLMHDIDLGDNALDGEYYRTEEVDIGTVAQGIRSSLVEEKMNELINFINETNTLDQTGISKTVALFIFNSLIHYQFVYIHPYYDGNGRMARIIAQWSINRISEIFNYIPISEIISYDKNNYYQAIQNVRDSYNSIDATYFVDFIIDKVILYMNTEIQIREIVTQLQNNLEVLTETEKSYIKIIYLSGLHENKFGYKDFNNVLKISDEEKTKQGIFKILNTLTTKGVLNSYIAKDNRTKFYDVVFKL